MAGQHFPTRHLLSMMLIFSIGFAAAGDSTRDCHNSDSSTCSASTNNVIYSNYGPDEDVDETEDVNDADNVIHMQMRLNVDVPLDGKAAAAPLPQELHEPAPPLSRELHKLSLAGAASLRPPHPVLAGQQPLVVKAPVVDSPAAAPLAASSPILGSTLQVSPPQFYTGNQLLLGAGIGAFLVIIGAVLAVFLRNCIVDRKGRSQDERMRQAWLLDWALGYDPDKDDEEAEPAKQVDTQLKLYPKKKQPPMATPDSDSGDTDEEEPEAESEDTATAEMLEDAVFVAEQVEVANEAMDNGYGMEMIGRRADQIQFDLR